MRIDITTKAARTLLPERQEPYWHPLRKGAALGYRAKATGTWIVRYTDKLGKIKYHAIGSQSDFSTAKSEAERFLAQLAASAHRAPARGTVRDALAAYLKHKRSIGRSASAWEAGKRFRLTVGRKSVFGQMKLADVCRDDLTDWRKTLRKGRSPRSINRQVRAVTAALNWATTEGGFSGNRDAWRLAALNDDSEHASPIFLTAEQRARLIAAAAPHVASFLEGLSHLGARPSELARATVADFDARGSSVTLWSRKGRNAKKRTRATVLSSKGLEFFRAQARGKLPKAPLIANASGEHFIDQQWCAGIERAIIAVNNAADIEKNPAHRIPKGASAYSFRHSRISELLQLYAIDPLTVAQQTGTSVQMLQLHYFRFIESNMRERLNRLEQANAVSSA
jgi:integrase